MKNKLEHLKKSVYGRYGKTGLFLVAGTVLNLLLMIVIMKTFGLKDYGEFATYFATVFIFSTIIRFGQDNLLLVSLAKEDGDAYVLRKAAKRTILLGGFLGILFTLATYIVETEHTFALIVLPLVIIVHSLNELFVIWLIYCRRQALSIVVQKIFPSLLTILLLISFNNIQPIIVHVFAILITFTIAFFFWPSVMNRQQKFTRDENSYGEILKHTSLVTISKNSSHSIPVFLINLLFGPESAAIFSLLSRIANINLQIIGVGSRLVKPETARRFNSTKKYSGLDTEKRITLINALLSTAVTVIICVNIPILEKIIDLQLSGTEKVLLLFMLLSTMFKAFTGPVHQTLLLAGYSSPLLKSEVLKLLCIYINLYFFSAEDNFFGGVFGLIAITLAQLVILERLLYTKSGDPLAIWRQYKFWEISTKQKND